MKSGHHGSGTLSFGVGDNGGLGPLLAAQKNGTIIPSADLDLFSDYGKGRTLIGKYLSSSGFALLPWKMSRCRVTGQLPYQDFTFPIPRLSGTGSFS
jgi:hypothetical protein